MSNKVYIVIIALLLGVVGWMAYSLNNKDKEIIYINQEKGTVMDERDGLELELESMKMMYDTMTVDNEEMQQKLDEQMAQIEQLQKKVKNRDYDVSKLRAEAETLRGIMKNYIHQIDSLNQLNQQLTLQRDAEANRANEAVAKSQQLEGDLQTTKEMVSKGAQLSAGEYVNTGVFERNSGKVIETERAAKAESIRSCFKVRKNSIAKPGTRMLYVNILGPDGKTLTGSSSGTVKVGGQDTPYSVTREVDYQQKDVDVCVYYKAPDKYEFKKGNYKVFIYEGGAVIGQTDVVLK